MGLGGGGGGGAFVVGETPSRVWRCTGAAAVGAASTGGIGCVTVAGTATTGAGLAAAGVARIGSGGGGGAAVAATTGGGAVCGPGAASSACCAGIGWVSVTSRGGEASSGAGDGAEDGLGAGTLGGVACAGFAVRLIGAMPSKVCLVTACFVATGAGTGAAAAIGTDTGTGAGAAAATGVAGATSVVGAGEAEAGPGAGAAGSSSSQDGVKLSASRSASSRLSGADDGGPLPGRSGIRSDCQASIAARRSATRGMARVWPISAVHAKEPIPVGLVVSGRSLVPVGHLAARRARPSPARPPRAERRSGSTSTSVSATSSGGLLG
jgi:hypothetical protein